MRSIIIIISALILLSSCSVNKHSQRSRVKREIETVERKITRIKKVEAIDTVITVPGQVLWMSTVLPDSTYTDSVESDEQKIIIHWEPSTKKIKFRAEKKADTLKVKKIITTDTEINEIDSTRIREDIREKEKTVEKRGFIPPWWVWLILIILLVLALIRFLRSRINNRKMLM